MAGSSTHDVTQLLRAWSEGEQSALEKLMPIVYNELRRSARRHMAYQRPDHTLQATALVNEVYLRLVNFREVTWQNRANFFAVCSKLMRQVLTDFARSRRSLKRRGEVAHVSLDQALVVSPEVPADLLALDGALTRLGAVDSRKSQVVEMRFFGGLSVEETAEVLKVSQETVLRDWKLAKMWLLRELTGEKSREKENGP